MQENEKEELRKILSSHSDLSQASLATRILVGRMRGELATNPDLLEEKVEELSKFVILNDFAWEDLKDRESKLNPQKGPPR